MKLNVNHLELEKVLFLFPLLSGYFSKFARTATLSTSHKGDDALSIVRGICSTCGRNRVRYCLGGCPWVYAPRIYRTLLCFYIRDSYNVLTVGMASVTKSLVSARFSVHFPQCGNRHWCRFKVG